MTSCQKISGTEGGNHCPIGFAGTAEEERGLARPPLLPSLRKNTAEAAEWEALQTERDPELYASGVFRWALRQEQEGRLELAAQGYAALLSGQFGAGEAWNLYRPEQARRQLEALQGRGDFGARTEIRLRNFAQQAADPAQLFAMAAAGAAFRLTRLGVLSRLSLNPKLGTIIPFLGPSRLATLAGFAVEAPTFTLATHLGNDLLGRDVGSSDFGREIASSYLVLGAMKLAGWASGEAYRGLAAAHSETPVVQSLFQQTGLLTGIMLGHRAEELAGLRPPRNGATTLTDSLATLVQFHVGGNLTKQAFGPGFQAWERQIDLKTEALTGNFPDSGDFSWTLSTALAVGNESSVQRFRVIPSNYLLNKKHSKDGSDSEPGEDLPRDTIRDGLESPFATNPKSGARVSQNEDQEPIARYLDELSPEEKWIRAYLNGELNSADNETLEHRLQTDPEFKEEFLQIQLLDYLDGYLNPEQREAFERELAANPRLQAHKKGILALDKLVGLLVPEEPVEPTPITAEGIDIDPAYPFGRGERVPVRPSEDSFVLFLGDREWLLDFSRQPVFFLTQNREGSGWGDVFSNLQIQDLPPTADGPEKVVALLRIEGGKLWLRPGDFSQPWTPVSPESIDMAPASFRPLGELLTQEIAREWPLYRDGLDLLPEQHFEQLLQALETVERGQRKGEFAQLRATHRQFTNAGIARPGEWPSLEVRENPYFEVLDGLYPQEAEVMVRMLWPILERGDFPRQDRASLMLQAILPRLSPERQRVLVDLLLGHYVRAPEEGRVWRMMYGGTTHHPLEILLGPLSESLAAYAYQGLRERLGDEDQAAGVLELVRRNLGNNLPDSELSSEFSTGTLPSIREEVLPTRAILLASEAETSRRLTAVAEVESTRNASPTLRPHR